jgi:hypothetical protein
MGQPPAGRGSTTPRAQGAALLQVHVFAPTNAVFARDGKHVLTTAADASAVVTEVKDVHIDLGSCVAGLPAPPAAAAAAAAAAV